MSAVTCSSDRWTVITEVIDKFYIFFFEMRMKNISVDEFVVVAAVVRDKPSNLKHSEIFRRYFS
jgi:hypothetical protein